MAKYGMTEGQYKKMKNWCNKYKNNPGVKKWLKKNPPPKIWKGTKIEYAYTEMPTWNIE